MRIKKKAYLEQRLAVQPISVFSSAQKDGDWRFITVFTRAHL
jgi:hypothetical protein